jgi:hypothetical protein
VDARDKRGATYEYVVPKSIPIASVVAAIVEFLSVEGRKCEVRIAENLTRYFNDNDQQTGEGYDAKGKGKFRGEPSQQETPGLLHRSAYRW